MKVTSSIASLLVLLVFTSCKPEQPVEAIQGQVVFFDLKKIVEEDIRDLEARSCGLKRSVTIDGKTETHLSQSPDLDKELKPLLEADINKPAWRDQFHADTTKIHDVTTIRYTTNSDKISVKSLRVFLQGDTLQKAEIRKSIRSFAFSFDSEITYYPGKGYDIHTEQKAFLIPKFVLQIEATFACP